MNYYSIRDDSFLLFGKAATYENAIRAVYTSDLLYANLNLDLFHPSVAGNHTILLDEEECKVNPFYDIIYKAFCAGDGYVFSYYSNDYTFDLEDAMDHINQYHRDVMLPGYRIEEKFENEPFLDLEGYPTISNKYQALLLLIITNGRVEFARSNEEIYFRIVRQSKYGTFQNFKNNWMKKEKSDTYYKSQDNKIFKIKRYEDGTIEEEVITDDAVISLLTEESKKFSTNYQEDKAEKNRKKQKREDDEERFNRINEELEENSDEKWSDFEDMDEPFVKFVTRFNDDNYPADLKAVVMKIKNWWLKKMYRHLRNM